MTADMPNVCAIIVTYYPDQNNLQCLLDSLVPQVDGVVIVDNGSPDNTVAWLGSYKSNKPIRVIYLGENKGIAAAQNAGIDYLRKSGAQYIVMFDHDSLPAPDMVKCLYDVALAKQASGVNVASVGPQYRDERQDNPPPFFRLHGLRVKRQVCTESSSVVEVSHLIASGCLIPMRALDVVGGMREELFIDYVDVEWGLRAGSKGFVSFGACGAFMSHQLGDEPLCVFGRSISLHSPLRHYYQIRNAMYLYRQGYLPINWKLADSWRLLRRYAFYSLFAKPRHRHWWMMTKGAWHGLFGRMGRFC